MEATRGGQPPSSVGTGSVEDDEVATIRDLNELLDAVIAELQAAVSGVPRDEGGVKGLFLDIERTRDPPSLRVILRADLKRAAARLRSDHHEEGATADVDEILEAWTEDPDAAPPGVAERIGRLKTIHEGVRSAQNVLWGVRDRIAEEGLLDPVRAGAAGCRVGEDLAPWNAFTILTVETDVG